MNIRYNKRLKYKILNKHKKNNKKMIYNLTIATIMFKFNNVFINLSKFTNYSNIFIFITMLKALSCGQFKHQGYSYETNQHSRKLSIATLNKLLNKFILFLVDSNNRIISLVFKNNSYNKRNLLNIFMQFHILKGIHVKSISYVSFYPYNGCRLQKRKFK